MPIEAARRFKDKQGRWRVLSDKRHPDNVSHEDPEVMRDASGAVYSCACCGVMLRYTDDTYLMPTLTEVGFVAELVGGCCSERYEPTIHSLRAKLDAEVKKAKKARQASERSTRRRLANDQKRHQL